MPRFSSSLHRRALRPTAAGVALLLIAGACTGAAGEPVATVSSAPRPSLPPSTNAPGTTPDAAASPADSATPGVVLTQSWATAELTDVRNGTSFRIADLVASDRVVFIETMAIWCTNCRAQQREVVTALARLDPGRVTWIGVDVDASESVSDLADYSRSLGFDWPFVVGSDDVLRALADEFGNQVLSPPSTPLIVVGTDGTVTLTEFGPKSVDRIVELAAVNGA